jgi:hypothetical protein
LLVPGVRCLKRIDPSGLPPGDWALYEEGMGILWTWTRRVLVYPVLGYLAGAHTRPLFDST